MHKRIRAEGYVEGHKVPMLKNRSAGWDIMVVAFSGLVLLIVCSWLLTTYKGTSSDELASLAPTVQAREPERPLPADSVFTKPGCKQVVLIIAADLTMRVDQTEVTVYVCNSENQVDGIILKNSMAKYEVVNDWGEWHDKTFALRELWKCQSSLCGLNYYLRRVDNEFVLMIDALYEAHLIRLRQERDRR